MAPQSLKNNGPEGIATIPTASSGSVKLDQVAVASTAAAITPDIAAAFGNDDSRNVIELLKKGAKQIRDLLASGEDVVLAAGVGDAVHDFNSAVQELENKSIKKRRVSIKKEDYKGPEFAAEYEGPVNPGNDFIEITEKKFLEDFDKCRESRLRSDSSFNPSSTAYAEFIIPIYDYKYMNEDDTDCEHPQGQIRTDIPYPNVRSLLGMIHDNEAIVDNDDSDECLHPLKDEKSYAMNWFNKVSHSGFVLYPCDKSFPIAFNHFNVHLYVPKKLVPELIIQRTTPVHVMPLCFTGDICKRLSESTSVPFNCRVDDGFMFEDIGAITDLLKCPEVEIVAGSTLDVLTRMNFCCREYIHPEYGMVFTNLK